MPDPFEESEITGIERFAHLEDRLYRVVEVFKAQKKEINYLRRENLSLKEEVLRLKQEMDQHSHRLDRLQNEREEIKNRVRKVLHTLSVLESSG